MSQKADHSVARVTEVIASSTTSFDDAIAAAVDRATQTLRGVRGAWIKDMKVDINEGKIANYNVGLMITFVMDE